MKPFSLLSEIAGAALLTVAAGAMTWIAGAFALPATMLPWLVTVLAALCLAGLVCRAEGHSGRLTLLGAWSFIALLLVVLDATPLTTLLAHSVMLALARTWLLRRRLFAGAAEITVALVAVAAAVATARHTHSIVATTWCFFLVHAASAWLPLQRDTSAAQHGDTDRFETAHRQAEAALRRLGRIS